VYELAVLTLFPAAVIFAAFNDLVSYRIPNKISLFLIGAFLCLAPFAGMNVATFGAHIGAGALVLAVTVGMFFAGFMGGGDAKLLAAVALWMGFDQLLPFVLWASLMGGGLTLALLAFRQLPLPASVATETWVAKLHAPRGPVPYGIAISAGGLFMYPHTIWCKALIG
jgi:prepilin peptidase CpaA